MASSVMDRDDKASVEELRAPKGWKKMIIQKKTRTPGRNAIVFVSPTGEEIKSKAQLDRYLKSHPGGASSSEFDWSTGETPRRSRRISEKSKASDSPESEPPRKRQSKSRSKQVADEEDKVAEDGDTAEEKEGAVVGEEAKTEEDVEMKEAEDQVTDNKTDEKEQCVANDPTTAELTDTNKEEADKQKEPEAPSEAEDAKAGESDAAHGEKVENAAPSKADDYPKEERKPDEPKGDEEDSIDKEVPTQKLPSGGELQGSNDDLKEREDGSRSVDKCPAGLEEKTSHEPKASEVSC